MNSRQKGARGERQWRDELRANGYAARRGQQFSGSPESPDVVCDSLPWIHFEVKAVERLNIEDAMEQARRDSARVAPVANKVPIVVHKRSFRPWLVTMEAATFFRFLRGDFLTEGNKANEGGTREIEGADSQSQTANRQIEDFEGGALGERRPTNFGKGALRTARPTNSEKQTTTNK